MPEMTAPVRIAIADDHPIFRDGLRALLEREPDFTVVGDAGDGRTALALVDGLSPDLLLLDVAMPHLTGMAVLEQLAERGSAVKTVLLTGAVTSGDIVRALQLGARGVVLKESPTALLFECIRRVMAGQYWVGRDGVADLVQVLRSLTSEIAEQQQRQFGLTKRELTIVGAIVSGLSNKEIASRLSISEDTVKHHLSNIFNKAGVSSRLELALFAVHHKLVDGF
ncbi:MAG: response regulator transcription factor [Acidobacteria bacterium]|nr:response regulator transcription factor [Acidobacteriota bacterium]